MNDTQTKRVAFSVSLNVSELQQRGFTADKIERLKRSCRNLSPQTVKKFGAPALLVLEGKNGERASVRHEYSHHDAGVVYFSKRKVTYNPRREGGGPTTEHYTLLTEFPLAFTAKEQRKWLQMVSNFYRPLLAVQRELFDSKKSARWLTKEPYKQTKLHFNKSKHAPAENLILRERSFAQCKKPHGSGTGLRDYLSRRDTWLRRRYAELRREVGRTRLYERDEEVGDTLKKELTNQSFGVWKPSREQGEYNPLDISVDRIKKIVYSRSKNSPQ